ncbi:MAG: acyltransferase [Thermoleophilia bacterium]
MSVFPRENIGFLDVAADVEVHDAFFNLQDRIVLEEGVVLGHQVMFLTGAHAMTACGVDRGIASRGPILVKQRAWIASRAIILGGVTIGEGSAVGAGSVVTVDVPDHEFWAGNPARSVRPIVSGRDGSAVSDGRRWE